MEVDDITLMSARVRILHNKSSMPYLHMCRVFCCCSMQLMDVPVKYGHCFHLATFKEHTSKGRAQAYIVAFISTSKAVRVLCLERWNMTGPHVSKPFGY